MNWTDTKTEEEARKLDRDMWALRPGRPPDGGVLAEAAGPALEDGEFWSVALARIKNDPEKRYAMARRHLPLPAAWSEMAVSLRMRIRKARKEKRGFEPELRELHHLAAMSSYAGYGLIERVPYARLVSLDLAYERIGCDGLLLLGATDRKWMKACWGDPASHSTAAELYSDMLAEDIRRIGSEREEERRQSTVDFLAGWQTDAEEAIGSPNKSPDQVKPRGLLAWLFGR